jgi:acetyl-CoA synthetase
MINLVNSAQLIELGLPSNKATAVTTAINQLLLIPAETAWQEIIKNILHPELPFGLHLFLFATIYPDWQTLPTSAPAWIPDPQASQRNQLARFMHEQQINCVAAFHQWTTRQQNDFLTHMLRKLNIKFAMPPTTIRDLSQGDEFPKWLPGAKLNIIESCFNAPATAIAIIYPDQNNQPHTYTYGQLAALTNRIANSLVAQGFLAGEAIAIALPLTLSAVAIYLAIIKMGGIVVGIADSFSSQEIATRLEISKAKAIFTQDILQRGGKDLPLYEKVLAAASPKTIVIPAQQQINCTLRKGDLLWQDFLVDQENYTSYNTDAMATCNILFSSGTTGIPKAIPWNPTTAIKAASDAYLHQDIHSGDILAWPTNLGWMMGPWLIFAALINQATLAVYADTPTTRAFGEFIQNAGVTMLGVVPTLVAAWRQSGCMSGLNWQQIKCFSSTGECSNAEDMLYLMSLAHYKPVIEYCGGTEIGGSYLTSTLIQKNYPALFSTPAMGVDVVILNDEGQLADDGEVALVPPALGLSCELLNANHHDVYFAGMPELAGKPLRRHGDQVHRLANGYYRMVGRVDDTMNLSGIKISAVEIERTLVGLPSLTETAAVAVNPSQTGPAQLIIFAVTTNANADKHAMQSAMQQRINQQLSPLFKIHDLVFLAELPKTASNKLLRRQLRKSYPS